MSALCNAELLKMQPKPEACVHSKVYKSVRPHHTQPRGGSSLGKRFKLFSPSSNESFVGTTKVYLFGGRAKSGKCASPVVGSSALGDTPGGAAIYDCMGGNGFR